MPTDPTPQQQGGSESQPPEAPAAPLDSARWQLIGEVFHRALTSAPEHRAALLDTECGDDDDLRSKVEQLLIDDAAPNDLVDDFDLLSVAQGPDPLINRRLGVYRLTHRIAVGGMGVVYKAVRDDGLFDQEVAVKLIRADAASEETIRRFELERRTLAALDHPNIARLFDAGTLGDGGPYFVMEFVQGLPIDTFCDQHQLTIPDRLRLFAKICSAVHFAHKNLVVHRDIKPANILIDEQGRPKLLDFGIARLVEESDDEDLSEHTITQGRFLTPEYASPEQLTGGPITTATDVYSLGVVLYRLLTGQRPYHSTSRSPADWERMITDRAPTRPSTAVARPSAQPKTERAAAVDAESFASLCGTTPARLRQLLSGDLDRIILMALRKEPERRYDSALDLADDLHRHLAGRPVMAREASAVYRATRFVQRNSASVVAALMVLAALIYGTVAAKRGESLARFEARHAQVEAESLDSITHFLMDSFLASKAFWSEEQREIARERIRGHAERVRRQYPDEVHLAANLLDSLGHVCMLLDLADDAEELLDEAYRARVQEFGDESLEVALSLGSLGELAVLRGQYDRAAGHLRQALELHRTLPVGSHTDVATNANNLAVALRHTGDLGGSIALHREALALRRANADQESPGAGAGAQGGLPAAESLNNLAGIHLDLGEFSKAHELLESSLEIRESILGDEDVLTAQSLTNLANACWRLGHHDEARTLLDRAEGAYRGLRAQGFDGLAQTLTSRGAMEMTAGEVEEAIVHFEEALQIQLDSYGPDHPAVAAVLSKLALILHQLGRVSDAAETWGHVIRIRRASSPPTSPKLGRTLQEYGVFLYETGDRAAAEAAQSEAVEILSVSPSAHPAVLARAELCLGVCLLDDGRLDAAEQLLRAGDQRLRSTAGISAAELLAADGYMARLSARRGEAPP